MPATYFPGTNIATNLLSSENANDIVDNYLSFRFLMFRQITIYEERCVLKNDLATWKTTYGNWNSAADLTIRKNGVNLANSSVTNIDYVKGTFRVGTPDLGLDNKPRDVVEATYEWDYFPTSTLSMLCDQALNQINVQAIGPVTGYKIDQIPLPWKAVIADIASAMMITRLLTDYNLWKWRLVYAITPGEVEGGGSDVVAQLESQKQTYEQNARMATQNPLFKCGQHIAYPTAYYYQAIRGMGSSVGAHGIPFVGGRLRGWQQNVWI